MKKVLIIILIVALEVTATPSPILAQESSDASSSAALSVPDIKDPTPTVDPSFKAAVEETPSPAISLDTAQHDTSAVIKGKVRLRALSKKDFTGTEDIVAVMDNIDSENVSVTLQNSFGKKMQMAVREIVYGSSRIFKVLPPSTLTPGKYTLTAKTASGETFTQDFTWGVLAINTNKSMYTPGETAKFSFAVLDETGAMVCDADLTLLIKGPADTSTLSTKDKTITANPECQVKDKTARADYEASTVVKAVGKYDLSLTANTKNGSYAIQDGFEVQENVPFSVERITATRIYPAKPYEVSLKITAHQDFDGTVSEIVPQSFEIVNQEGGTSQEVTRSIQADSQQEVLGASVVNLRMPFEGKHPIALSFGEQIQDPAMKQTYAQYGLSGHDGIDFDMPIGTPVLAVDDGTVTLAKDSDYGLTVVIQHSWGKSYYGHLSKIKTPLGTVVTKGQQIALSGNSGTSTGSHLHFGIKPSVTDKDNGYMGKVNPAPYLGIDALNTSDQYEIKFLNWNLSLKKGETTTLSYSYDAPDKSPEFYTIGPLALHASGETTTPLVFQESRSWQIAVDATTHMLLFWDPASGSVPAGWSVVTTYDGRYIRGEGVANVLATGGNATHTPTLSGSVTVSAASAGGNGGSTRTAASFGHTHTGSVTIGAAQNLPSFRSMQMIQYDAGIPTTIPQNAVAMYDASPGMPGSGWTRITAQDTRMLRVNSTVATGGSDTHTHTLTWGALTASSGQVTNAGNTNNAGANTGHTHTAPAATTTDSQTSLPPYIATVFASANSAVSVPDGMVALFDGDPGGQYLKLSESGGTYYQKFVRGDTQANAGTTGGSTTHSHGTAVSGASGTASSLTRGGTGSGTVEATAGHTHTLSASFVANDDHTPQYVNFVVARKVNQPVLNQNHYRWRNDDGSETTATWRRSEDVSATRNINGNIRLRMELSNDGSQTSGSNTYRLEYGQKSTTCAAVATWTAVPTSATTEHFQMYNSTNLTDGSATTNVSGGLTDGNTTFVVGEQKDTSNTTAGITLTNTQFTEIEYSIQVTSNATAGNIYCFRLTNAGSTTNFQYTTYAELTTGDPNLVLEHYRWRNDDSTEAGTPNQTLYYNPTGDGFASAFTVSAGCTLDWDCVDDGATDTSASAPTNDGATSTLTTANGVSYFTLADNQLLTGSTITRLDVYAYALDNGNPNTNIQVGYCTTCDGTSNNLGSAQAVNVASYTQYTSAFTGLSLTTSDLNNMQLVISADGTRALVSTVYVLVTYTKAGASWKQNEDTAHTGQATLTNMRLRFSVANTGNIAANRNYRLEYAPKVGATCGDDESFTTVPLTATTEAFEMTTSSNFSDGDATTAQLTSTGLGTFDSGKMIEDPSNSSGIFVATNGRYSEFEYNFMATSVATGSYCFRLSDNGTVLDSYNVYPELSVGGSASLDQLMRHGKYFSGGSEQPFTF